MPYERKLNLTLCMVPGFLDGPVLHGDHLPLPVFSRLQRHPRPHVSGLKKLDHQFGDGGDQLQVRITLTH